VNVVDSLIVSLGIDATPLQKGARDATAAAASMAAGLTVEAGRGEKAQSDAALKIVRALERIADAGEKTTTEGEKQGKRLVDANRSSTESVAALGRQFLGLYALLTAGKGVKQFVEDITSADAALGRTAHNLDMSGKNLSAWQNAATVAGGSAEGITGTLKGLTSEMQKAALTGQSGIIPVFRALGINLADAKGKARDAGDVLVDLNRKAQGMDPARFTELAHMAGIDDGTIALLEKSTAEFDKLRAEEQKYAATAEDIDAAQQRQSGWRQLLITSTSLGRTILTALTPAITTAMTAIQRWTDANQEWIKTKVVEYAERFGEWVKSVDWDKVGTDLETIATNVGSVASAFASAVKGVDSDSPLFKAFEAFGVMLAGSVLARLTGISSALALLGGAALPRWMSGLLTNPVVLGTAAVVAGATAESTPGAGVPADPVERAKVAEQNQRDTDAANAKLGQGKGFWTDTLNYIKGKLGFGDDPKLKEGISDTAKATGEMRDILKAQREGVGGTSFSGVTESSGGTGGSGRHFSGETAPGAQPIDRARGRHGGGGGGAAPAVNGGGGGVGPADANLPVGNVPGATGYGTINAYWKGPLDKRGEGGHTGPKEMFDYLKSQGATDNEALLLTGSAASESSFNPNAVHDNGTGHGLFGHKDTRLDMRGKNWQQQSVLALAEVRRTLGRHLSAARTPEELTDVEMHNERPRGYKPNNPRAGDNYMGRLNSIRRFSVLTGHPTATAPIPAGTSAQAVSDAEVFAARQRITNGGRDPKDRVIVERYQAQQALPLPPAQTPPVPVPKTTTTTTAVPPSLDVPRQKLADAMNGAPNLTVNHAVRQIMQSLAHARRLTTHANDNRPVSVEVTERSAERIGKSGREMLHDRRWGAHRAHVDHALARSHVAFYGNMARVAAAGPTQNHTVHHTTNNSYESRVGEMHVHPQTTDGRRFADEFRQDMMRRGDVVQSNGALA
jgi:hypothetical protein